MPAWYADSYIYMWWDLVYVWDLAIAWDLHVSHQVDHILCWHCFRKKNYAIDGCRKKYKKVYMPKVADNPVAIFVTKKRFL